LTQPQFSTQKLKAQANDAVLSFVQFPGALHYVQDAVEFIQEQTDGRQFVANVDYVDSDGTLNLTILATSSSGAIEDTINADVIREGLGIVPKKLKAWEKAAGASLKSLKDIEEEARQGHRGMFEYGDITED